jgi:hypothetical protein
VSADFWSIIELWLLFGLPLLVARELFPKTEGYLPLGGTDFKQCAILLMMATFFYGVANFFLPT